MGTTDSGIVYPDPADVPQRQNLQDLAESTDVILRANWIQRGSVQININAGDNWEGVTVLFPMPFLEVPTIVASVAGGTVRHFATASAQNIDGFQARVVDYDGSSTSATVMVDWIAMGPI